MSLDGENFGQDWRRNETLQHNLTSFLKKKVYVDPSSFDMSKHMKLNAL